MSFFCWTDKTLMGTMVFGRTAVLALGLDFAAFAVLALGLDFAACSGGTYLLGCARVLFISNIPWEKRYSTYVFYLIKIKAVQIGRTTNLAVSTDKVIDPLTINNLFFNELLLEEFQLSSVSGENSQRLFVARINKLVNFHIHEATSFSGHIAIVKVVSTEAIGCKHFAGNHIDLRKVPRSTGCDTILAIDDLFCGASSKSYNDLRSQVLLGVHGRFGVFI